MNILRTESINGWLLFDLPAGTVRHGCIEHTRDDHGAEVPCTRLGTVRVLAGTQPVMCRQHARKFAKSIVSCPSLGTLS